MGKGIISTKQELKIREMKHGLQNEHRVLFYHWFNIVLRIRILLWNVSTARERHNMEFWCGSRGVSGLLYKTQ